MAGAEPCLCGDPECPRCFPGGGAVDLQSFARNCESDVEEKLLAAQSAQYREEDFRKAWCRTEPSWLREPEGDWYGSAGWKVGAYSFEMHVEWDDNYNAVVGYSGGSAFLLEPDALWSYVANQLMKRIDNYRGHALKMMESLENP